MNNVISNLQNPFPDINTRNSISPLWKNHETYVSEDKIFKSLSFFKRERRLEKCISHLIKCMYQVCMEDTCLLVGTSKC